MTYSPGISGFSGTVGSSWNSVGVGDSTGGFDVVVAVTVAVGVSVGVGVSVTVGTGGVTVGVVITGTVGVVTSSDSSVVVVGVRDG